MAFAPEHAEERGDNPDMLRKVAEILEFIGETLGVDVTDITENLYTLACELKA